MNIVARLNLTPFSLRTAPERPVARTTVGGADFDTVVIGAGQAGLAAAYHLRRAGVRFVVFDAYPAIGHSWQRRWDSLRLFTSAKYDGLPGMAFPGDRYSLPTKEEVTAYFREYVQRFELPIRLNTAVQSLRREGRHFIITTAQGTTISATSVIVATGANQRPHRPDFAEELSPRITQLHSDEYRNPSQLPDGPVLVVGAGNSGAQIALELAASGRRVHLSGRVTGSLPRRLLGRDIYDWLWPTMMQPSLDTRLGRRLMQGRLFKGDPLVGIDESDLAGLERVARTTGTDAGHPLLQNGRVIKAVESVVWCTGYRPAFEWIELPVLGSNGYPLHRRGLAQGVPGLAFLGLRYQYRMSSALLGGVGRDAQYVGERIAAHVRARQ